MKTIPVRHIASAQWAPEKIGRFTIRDIQHLLNGNDLAPTFAALAGTQLTGEPDGRDIQHLLREQNTQKINWRNFAIIEHRRANYDRNDPDRQEAEDGRLPSYTALRFQNLLYVEYETGKSVVMMYRTILMN